MTARAVTAMMMLFLAPGSATAEDASDWIQLLQDPEPQFRAIAAKQLAELGPEAEAAIPHLIRTLGDTRTAERSPAVVTPTVRHFAIRALVSIGSPAVAPLIEAVREAPDPDIRIGAAGALREFAAREKSQNKIRRAFETALDSELDKLRQAAVRGLAEMGPAAKASLPAIVAVLTKDPSWRVRYEAVSAIRQIDQTGGESVLDALEIALQDAEPDVRSAAAQALGGYGEPAKKAVPALARLLKDRSKRQRRLAPDFVARRPVRCDAAEALGKIGPPAQEAIPALRKLLDSSVEGNVRVAAALALKRINSDSAEPLVVLLRELRSPPSTGSAPDSAARALKDLGSAASPVVPDLLRALKDPNPAVRARAASVLGAIGDSSAIPGLAEAQDDPHSDVRRAAEQALRALKEDNP